ncbi:MAG: hypothetical protein OEV64_01060 [Desulfobulbaceae bacterium]|nr:hypothetical protein [Desulfobulbaceae bacterium]
MKRLLKFTIGALLLSNMALLAACKTEVLKEIPQNGTLSYKEIVYVENDGRCNPGQVIKITGGKRSENIPRTYECVERP